MKHRARHVASALLVALASHGLAAQTPKITLDSVLTALHAGAIAIRFDTVDRARNFALDSLSALLRADRTADLTIQDLIAGATAKPPGFLEILRWDRDKVTRSTQPLLQAAFVRLQQIVLAQPVGLGPQIFRTLGASGYTHYVGAMEALQNEAILVVQAASTEKLRRYEFKFGTSAPRLNPVETIINYGLERVPGSGFAPGINGPSPLEFVANYSTSELTTHGSSLDDLSLHLTSGAYVGLRVYLFDTTASRSPLTQLTHPGTVAFGPAVFSPSDVALGSPLRSGRRWGGFIDWGTLRGAAAIGRQWRAMIGTSAQLIPHIF